MLIITFSGIRLLTIPLPIHFPLLALMKIAPFIQFLHHTIHPSNPLTSLFNNF